MTDSPEVEGARLAKIDAEAEAVLPLTIYDCPGFALTGSRDAMGRYSIHAVVVPGGIQATGRISLVDLYKLQDAIPVWIEHARAYDLAHPVEIPKVSLGTLPSWLKDV